jgi:hypothetical protein
MRIHFPSTRFPEDSAKRLKKAFAAAGGDVGRMTCQELIARATGYQDWYELRTVSGRGRVDPMDWQVDEEVFKARGDQYIATLTACGIAADTAAFIIDLAGPTGEGARGEELRPAVAAWKGPLQWTLRRDGPGYVVVAGTHRAEMIRRLGEGRVPRDLAPGPNTDGPAP